MTRTVPCSNYFWRSCALGCEPCGNASITVYAGKWCRTRESNPHRDFGRVSCFPLNTSATKLVAPATLRSGLFPCRGRLDGGRRWGHKLVENAGIQPANELCRSSMIALHQFPKRRPRSFHRRYRYHRYRPCFEMGHLHESGRGYQNRTDA
jgi:hypothetical protein